MPWDRILFKTDHVQNVRRDLLFYNFPSYKQKHVIQTCLYLGEYELTIGKVAGKSGCRIMR